MNDLPETLLDILPIIKDHIESDKLKDNKVISDIENIIDLNEKDSDVKSIIDKIFKGSVKTSHSMFLDKLYSGSNTEGVIGELITAILNTSMYTYNVSPVFTLMENEIILKINEMIGFTDGSGVMTPGGSYSNMMGLICARHQFNNLIKSFGNIEDLVVLTSASSHYSIKTAAIIMGIGSSSVVLVNTMENGSMDMNDLSKKILECKDNDKNIFALNLTAGTTVSNGFDNIREAKRVLVENNINCWIHLDACVGGALLFSDYKNLLDGINIVDSVSFNPHKMLGIPLQCSMILTKDKTILKRSSSLKVEYLYHDNNMDLGQNTMQCGRKVDSLKFWLVWKTLGTDYFKNRVNTAVTNANKLYNMMKNDNNFVMIHKPIAFTVCFYPAKMNFDMFLKEMNGKIMMDYTIDSERKYFRIVFNNPESSPDDIYLLLRSIAIKN